MGNNEKLLNEWERLNKQLEAIDYDDLEIEIYDIEKELEKRGFKIQVKLNKKREWVYELQKL